MGRWPDFLVVGAAKAGTSSLHRQLADHPRIHMSAVKEPNYFALGGKPADFRGPGDDRFINRHSVHDTEAYQALFRDAGGKAAGESSPLYLYDASVPTRIARELDDPKVVIVLRDPVRRAYSAFLHMRRDGREPEADFSAALDREDERVAAGWEFLWHYQRVSRYAEQLDRYLVALGSTRVLITTFDDLVSQLGPTMDTILRFLGVGSTGWKPVAGQRFNRTGEPRSRLLQQVLTSRGGAGRTIRHMAPPRVRALIRRGVLTVNLRTPELDHELARELRAEFAADVKEVERLTGLDLERWR